MHRDKTVARILLILSVVHVAAAAPAIVRQRSLDIDEDVTAASEKRGYPGNTPRGLYPVRQVDNVRPSASGTAQLDNDPPPASGAPHLYNDPPPASGTPQLDNDRSSALGTPQLDNDTPPASGAPQLHHDPLTEISSVHDDLPLGPESDFHHTPSLHELEVPSSHELEPGTFSDFINDVKNHKLQYAISVGVLGVAFPGLVYSLYKLSTYHSQPTGRDLTSSAVVGRGVSTHPRPPRRLVSRAPANLRNEDLGLLSVLTRRALERLD